MALLASSSQRAAAGLGRQSTAQAPAVAHQARSSSSSSSRVVVRSGGMDRETGFVAEDNSGRSNIFPTKQQAYIKSSAADAAARQGLGGAQGGILVGLVVAAVIAATVLTSKAPGPETLQTVSENLQGTSLSEIAARLKSSI